MKKFIFAYYPLILAFISFLLSALAADGCHDGVVGAVLDGGGRS